MEDSITLDRETFKTLASETRVGILKSLARRRKMLTELSREFGMSPSTIKEHLDNLAGAGLVVQVDDGHKWKYYELTGKGKDVLNPGETRIWIILTLSFLAIIFTAYDLLQKSVGSFQILARGGEMMAPAGPVADAGAQALLPYWHIMGFVVFSVILGLSLGYVLGKKRFYSFQGE